MSVTSGPLAGYVILDFTQILAGPFCTQMLADAGATVIKVEPPGGEFSRIRGPKRLNDEGQSLSSYSAAVNRGKRSICLDLKNPEGRKIAEQLIAKSDVVIENFRPGVFERLGLGFEKLRAERPELVTCSISLYGSYEFAGELALRGGLAYVAEAESSCTGMQRNRDGSPVPFGFPLADLGSGIAAYGGVVTALLNKERTGRGQHIDISMIRVCLALNSVGIAAEQILSGQEVELHELRTAAVGLYQTTDGFVAIAINSDSLFARLASAMDLGWMATDPRFAHYTERDQRADEIDVAIKEWASSRSTNEVVEIISASGVPCGPVATPRDILSSETIEELGFLEDVDDGLGGTIYSVANALGYQQPEYSIPRTNQHGEELLKEYLDVDSSRYSDLCDAGAFGAG